MIRFQRSSFSSGNVAALLQSKRGWLPGAFSRGGELLKSNNGWGIHWNLFGIRLIKHDIYVYTYLFSTVLKNANPTLRNGDFNHFLRVEPMFWIGNLPIGSIYKRQGLELF